MFRNKVLKIKKTNLYCFKKNSVIENIIEKEIIIEKEEDCLKPPEPEIDLEELRRKEEEEK